MVLEATQCARFGVFSGTSLQLFEDAMINGCRVILLINDYQRASATRKEPQTCMRKPHYSLLYAQLFNASLMPIQIMETGQKYNRWQEKYAISRYHRDCSCNLNWFFCWMSAWSRIILLSFFLNVDINLVNKPSNTTCYDVMFNTISFVWCNCHSNNISYWLNWKHSISAFDLT